MTLSRKEFFRQGFLSLGETLLKVGGAVRGARDASGAGPLAGAADREPLPDAAGLASADNRHCLAGNCGCFICVERCEARAIFVVMGQGIRIDQTLCTGCGTCEYVCPVTPKAVRMKPGKQVCKS